MPASKAVAFNGHLYYDVKTFAQLTNRTSSSIYHLIERGNAIRRIKVVRMLGKPLIPVEELSEYPFTAPGPRGKESVYHFKEEEA